MTSIFDFVVNVLGLPLTGEQNYFLYVIAGILALIFADGILTFFISGFSSLVSGGRR